MPEISYKAAEILIETLMDRLENAEQSKENLFIEAALIYGFFSDCRRDVLTQWINYVYKMKPDLAKGIVAEYHDELIDLSTIECSAADFKPWGRRNTKAKPVSEARP